MVTIRSYDRRRDAAEVWELKGAFERELGSAGTDQKRVAYEAKLTDEYRDQYLEWVGRCVEENPDCVQIALDDETVIGYVFVLPESYAYIWDGAVLNEIYVIESYRGTGVADELVQTGIDVASEQTLPLDRLLLDVDRENERAYTFYERHGFDHWGEMLVCDL